MQDMKLPPSLLELRQGQVGYIAVLIWVKYSLKLTTSPLCIHDRGSKHSMRNFGFLVLN